MPGPRPRPAALTPAILRRPGIALKKRWRPPDGVNAIGHRGSFLPALARPARSARPLRLSFSSRSMTITPDVVPVAIPMLALGHCIPHSAIVSASSLADFCHASTEYQLCVLGVDVVWHASKSIHLCLDLWIRR